MLGLVPPHDHGEQRRLLLPPTRHRHPEHGPGRSLTPCAAPSGSSVRLPAKLTLGSVMPLPSWITWARRENEAPTTRALAARTRSLAMSPASPGDSGAQPRRRSSRCRTSSATALGTV